MTTAPDVIDMAPSNTPVLAASSNIMTPMTLLQLAVQQGADLDKLQQLMHMKREWEADEARKAYNAAFAAFKGEHVRIVKNRNVTDGPLKGKKYAELFAIVNAVTPALSAHGLSASWSVVEDAKDWIKVRCTVKHNAGHFEFVEFGGPPDTGGAKNPIQARASCVTYLERLTLKAILGLSEQDESEDDDGNGGKDRDEGGAPPPPPATYDQARFDANLDSWRDTIANGRTTPERLIGFIEIRGAPLSEAQKKTILGLKA